MMKNKPPQPLDYKALKALLPLRAPHFSKWDAGHVAVIGGNSGMSGAVMLAGEAALRVGVGLVSVITHPKHAHFINLHRPELMCSAVEHGSELAGLSARANVILLGNGLGRDDWAQALFAEALSLSPPKVLDADALNLLSTQPIHRDDWILTPHCREAARLLGVEAIAEPERVAALIELQQRYGGVIVLKGQGTLIYDGDSLTICEAGNPGMATAGMGDVLAGIIAGLLAQGLTLVQAAQLGVVLHATAGDLVAKNQGMRGMIASDIFAYLSKVLND